MNNNKVQAIVEKVKELVQRGNVSRIVVRKGERVLLNIPVNVGIVGGVVAVASAKWVLLASILATVGFGCERRGRQGRRQHRQRYERRGHPARPHRRAERGLFREGRRAF